MEEVKVTENIPDDVVNIIFDFCKAFNGAKETNKLFLRLEDYCDFSFDFQGRNFFCKKTYGSTNGESEACIIDVLQDDHLVKANVENEKIKQDEYIEFNNDKSELNKDINKNKNEDNKVNGEISDEKEDVLSISDDNDIIKINDIKKNTNQHQ